MAMKYRELTGKPLGITGEMAEFSAAQTLGLELAEALQAGYDAVWNDNGILTEIQIKGRCIPADAKPGQRLGSIRLDKEWDTVLLVIFDEDLELVGIYAADRPEIAKALLAPGSKARNKRGALGVSKFKSKGREIWSRQGL